MTKSQYKAARQLIRDNGLYALRWLSDSDRLVFEKLFYGQKFDHLQERAFWINSTNQRIKRGVSTRQTIKRVILATPLF